MLDYQEVLTLAVTPVAAGYLAWRVWRAWQRPYNSVCSGCRCCLAEADCVARASAANAGPKTPSSRAAAHHARPGRAE